jgi:hypothetical protein
MATALAKNEPQALAEVMQELRRDPIALITQNYDRLAQFAIVMFPPTALDAVPPMMKPSATIVKVDMTKNARGYYESKDVYFITSDQLGLSKQVILRMLRAAGASAETRKLSPRTDLENIRWGAWVWGRSPDGSMQIDPGSKSWSWQKCQDDFVRKAVAKPREGETPEGSRARGLDNARQYREFADEQTETKALLRAARAWLGLQTSYKPADLEKPFAFLKAVPDPDLSDPEIKRLYAEKMIDSMGALYGPGMLSALPKPDLPPLPAEAEESEFDDEEGEGAPLAEVTATEPPANDHPPDSPTADQADTLRIAALAEAIWGENVQDIHAFFIAECDCYEAEEVPPDRIAEVNDKLSVLLTEKRQAEAAARKPEMPVAAATPGAPDETDARLAALAKDLGPERWAKVLEKLKKDPEKLVSYAPHIKKAILNYGLGIQQGKGTL